jgi:hypothetical protein
MQDRPPQCWRRGCRVLHINVHWPRVRDRGCYRLNSGLTAWKMQSGRQRLRILPANANCCWRRSSDDPAGTCCMIRRQEIRLSYSPKVHCADGFVSGPLAFLTKFGRVFGPGLTTVGTLSWTSEYGEVSDELLKPPPNRILLADAQGRWFRGRHLHLAHNGGSRPDHGARRS